MPMLMFKPPRGYTAPFPMMLPNTDALSPVQSMDAKMIVEAAERILKEAREDSQRKPRIFQRRGSLESIEFEADVIAPVARTTRIAEQRSFIAQNQRDWVDVDLPPLP